MIQIITWYKETLFLFCIQLYFFAIIVLKGEFMNIDIRKSIKDNFKNSDIEEIRKSIEESIKDKDEITLPGLGVFFEILWENTSDKEEILNTLKKGL